MLEKPSYYAVIPANVRYDNSISNLCKLLYGEITSLCDSSGVCTAGNDYFANIYDVKNETISRSIKRLKVNGYISISYERKGSKISKRNILICTSNLPTNIFFTDDKKINGIGLTNDKKVKENNIYIYKYINIIKYKYIYSKFFPQNLKLYKSFPHKNTTRFVKKKIYIEDDRLNDLFLEFLDMRKKMKCVNSERSIKILLNKLKGQPYQIQKEMLENSIESSWKSLYLPTSNQKFKKNYNANSNVDTYRRL